MTGMPPQLVALCSGNSRCGRGDEERTSRRSIGKNKIWTLAYADDLVLLAKNEESMKETMKRLDRYLRNKYLQVNAEKSKMLCFRKGGGRRRRVK